eukprot:13387355-Alexandrium_andersonii.AAC.1
MAPDESCFGSGAWGNPIVDAHTQLKREALLSFVQQFDLTCPLTFQSEQPRDRLFTRVAWGSNSPT